MTMKSNTEQIRQVMLALAGGHTPPQVELRPGAALATPLWEPDDFRSYDVATELAALATGSGGTEAKFSRDGIVVPGPGAVGVFWSRSLRQRWAPVASGRMIPFTAEGGLYFGYESGGIPPGGVLSLEFYVKPDDVSWWAFRDWVEAWTRGQMNNSGSGSGSGGTTSATSQKLTIKGYDGVTYDSRAVPGTGRRTIQPLLDTNTPPGPNDPNAVFCVASSAALSQAGSGILILPGGTYDWPGGPAWVTEIADLGSAADQYVNVVY